MSKNSESATLPWKHLKVVRRDDMPIRDGLNLTLVLAVGLSAIVLLWGASQLSHWGWTIGLGMVFSYLMLTNYALMHEAIHLNLQNNLKRNYVLGVIASMFFPVSFTMVQVTHQGHHYRNRTDAEIFDQYYPGFWSRVFKSCQWYGTLLGFFYILVVLASIATALLPGTSQNSLVTGKEFGNGNLKDITMHDVWKIRLEMLLTVSFWALVVWGLSLQWQVVLVMFLMGGFNWSTRQYIAHAYSERSVLDGAFNLKHNRFMSALLLHGEWDLNHHRYPDVPWTNLPDVPADDKPRISYWKHYLRMWGGPVEVTEPEPDMWNTEQMIEHLTQQELRSSQST